MQTKVSYTVGETTNAGYLNKYLYTVPLYVMLYCMKVYVYFAKRFS